MSICDKCAGTGIIEDTQAEKDNLKKLLKLCRKEGIRPVRSNLLTPADIAKLTRKKKRTVQNWLRDNYPIKRTKLGPRNHATLNEVANFLFSQKK